MRKHAASFLSPVYFLINIEFFLIYSVANEAEASARWGVLGGVRGVCECGAISSLLYYPDTLVDPDTCLGYLCSTTLIFHRSWVELVESLSIR